MPDVAVYGPPSLDKALGSLPVVASFPGQLNVAAIIGELCPVRDVALATRGQIIEAMIANRLTSPTPLVRVIDWARARCPSWTCPRMWPWPPGRPSLTRP